MRKMKLKDQSGINYVPYEVYKKAQDKKKKEEAALSEYKKKIDKQKQNAIKIAQDKKKKSVSTTKASTSVIGNGMRAVRTAKKQ